MSAAARHCRRCGAPLNESQPDESDYVRTLLACTGCGRWYVRIAPPGRMATVTPLPVATLDQLGVVLDPATPAA